jgi:hypothetical protein
VSQFVTRAYIFNGNMKKKIRPDTAYVEVPAVPRGHRVSRRF